MRIAVVGVGYVGLVVGTCLAKFGNHVICVDIDKEKIEGLKKGIIPIKEPHLEELVLENLKKGYLEFSDDIDASFKKSQILFIAVGTPKRSDGSVDLSYVESVVNSLKGKIEKELIIATKSTVPVGTARYIYRELNEGSNRVHVASNPEFLREGSAVKDFLFPERIVVGTDSDYVRNVFSELYKPLNAPILFTDPESAELIKYASNAFLATKISFINEIARLCENVSADVEVVAKGMGMDSRIGPKFLNAGIGYGGSCFPKDVSALYCISKKHGYNFRILRSVMEVNAEQKKILVKKIKDYFNEVGGLTFGVLGLAFKPDTDDMREASSIDIIKELHNAGARIKAYAPCARKTAEKVFSSLGIEIEYVDSPYLAAKGSDALIIATEYKEFSLMDLEKLKELLNQPVIFDGRNVISPGYIKEHGFDYISIGRKSILERSAGHDTGSSKEKQIEL